MSRYYQQQQQQQQRSPTVSFLSPPPRSSFHDRQQHQHQQTSVEDDVGDIGAAPGSGASLSLSDSGRRISSLAMLNSAGSAGSGDSASRGHRAGGGRASASITSATSAFAPTPRKLLDTGTPGSAGSHGTILRSSSLVSGGGGGGGGASMSSTGPGSTGRSTVSALGLTSIGGTAHNPSSAHSAITAHSNHSHGGGYKSASVARHAQATPTSMMLVPPSQTITTSLQQLAASTAVHLEAVWDEVGYSPDERAAQLSDLLAKFRQVCNDKVAEERGVAQTFRKEIDAAREEIVHLSQALKVKIDPELWDAVQKARRREERQGAKQQKPKLDGNDGDSTGSDGGDVDEEGGGAMATPNSPYYRPSTAANLNAISTTLTDELASLEVTLDDLRSSASAATEDLTECRTKLQSAHAALGTDLEDEWKDVTTDLTDDRRRAFHQHVAEMDQELQLRTQTIVGLLKDCQHLIRELRVEADASSGQFGPRDQPSLDRQIMGSLARDPVSDDIVMTSTEESEDCTGIGSRALEELTERVAELNGEKRRRKARLGEMGAEIATLWEKLHVPEAEQRAFAESVKGLGMDTIRKGEVELGRLLELKAAMMGRLIDEARDEIERLWEETSATDSQRSAFRAFGIADENRYSDELLAEHDAYIQHLQRRYEQMQPILKVIAKREEIIRERMEYEELQKDPTRLQQRGSALTKQLMKEEKIARRIKKDLPKATDYLERKLQEWRKIHDEPFLYHGEVYLNVMQRQQEEWNTYKENEMALKLQKRQEQKNSNRNTGDSGYYAKPLSGAKWGGRGGGKGGGFGNQPLADVGNHATASRAPSRAKSRGRALGDDRFDHQSKPGYPAQRAASRSRPISRGRVGLKSLRN